MGRKRKRPSDDAVGVTSVSSSVGSDQVSTAEAPTSCSPDRDSSSVDGPPRNAANERERARMRVLSRAFTRLKTSLPWVPADTKLSKLDTLRLASCYIAHLSRLLAEDDDNKADAVTAAAGSDDVHSTVPTTTTPNIHPINLVSSSSDVSEGTCFNSNLGALPFPHFPHPLPSSFLEVGPLLPARVLNGRNAWYHRYLFKWDCHLSTFLIIIIIIIIIGGLGNAVSSFSRAWETIRRSSSQNRILCILTLRYDIWW